MSVYNHYWCWNCVDKCCEVHHDLWAGRPAEGPEWGWFICNPCAGEFGPSARVGANRVCADCGAPLG